MARDLPLSANDIKTYEDQIIGLRVNELQAILGTFQRPKLGKKQELVQRCIALLKSNLQSQVVNQVREMNRRNARPAPYARPVLNPGYPMQNYGGSTLAMHHPYHSAAPKLVRGLRVMPLPFYDLLEVITDPVELPAIYSGVKTNTRLALQFAIPREKMQSVYYRGERMPPRSEIQLRFFQLGSDWRNVEQPDDFPLNCAVKIDDCTVQLPNIIPTNKPNAEPKRPSRPVNITQYCQPPRDASRPHRLLIEWTGDRRVYACAIYLVYRVTADILRDRLVANSSMKLPMEATRDVVIRRLAGDEDGIKMDQLKISLLCPLGKTRMSLPARCRDCTHLQCFDLDLYLRMNEKRPTWKCAVCSGSAPYDRLIIDGYFERMLWELDNQTTEVELLRDGSFQKINEEVLDLSDDDGPATATPSTAGGGLTVSQAPTPTSIVAGSSRQKIPEDDVIVLSDSDDDDDMQRAIADSHEKLKVIPSTECSNLPQSSSLNKSNDSIIILDDTPPHPIGSESTLASSHASSPPGRVDNSRASRCSESPICPATPSSSLMANPTPTSDYRSALPPPAPSVATTSHNSKPNELEPYRRTNTYEQLYPGQPHYQPMWEHFLPQQGTGNRYGTATSAPPFPSNTFPWRFDPNMQATLNHLPTVLQTLQNNPNAFNTNSYTGNSYHRNQ